MILRVEAQSGDNKLPDKPVSCSTKVPDMVKQIVQRGPLLFGRPRPTCSHRVRWGSSERFLQQLEPRPPLTPGLERAGPTR